MMKQHQREYRHARSLAAQQMWGIRLQVERLRSGWWVEARRFAEARIDFEFLIGALWRLRRSVLMAQGIEPLTSTIVAMVADFDAALPVLKRLRNVGEHFDSRTIEVDPKELLGAVEWEGAFTWLGQRVDYEGAETAATSLFRRFRELASIIGESPAQHPLDPA